MNASERITVLDGNGVPSFAFSFPELDAHALRLAGLLAVNADAPTVISEFLEDAAAQHSANPVYFAGLLLRSLRFLAEYLLAPVLDVAERAAPHQDFRAQLLTIAGGDRG